MATSLLFVGLFLFHILCTTSERTTIPTPILITQDLGNSSNWVNVGIVGGTPVGAATDYPFMAAYVDAGFQFCGASLISETFAITAAHCIGARFPTSEYITLGSLRHDGAGTPAATQYAVEETFIHPDYNRGTLAFDAALLKLATPVEFSPTRRPVKLAPATSEDFSGWESICTGWGLTTEGGRPSPVLREVDLPIISNQFCSTMYNGIVPSMLCAYLPGKDSCQGDSGGPLFVEDSGDSVVQVGFVSWGIGCAGVGAPGVYARISEVIDWVCLVARVGC